MNTRKPFTGHISLARGKTECLFLPSGDIYALLHDGLIINGFRGSPSAGSINQIYLRVEGVGAVPLLGLAAGGSVSVGQNSITK